MNLKDCISNNLKVLRRQYGLSSKDISIYTDIPSSTVSYWETKFRLMGSDYATIISNFFAVSIDWLLGRSANPYNVDVLIFLENEFINDSVDICSSTPFDEPDNKGRYMQLHLPKEYLDVKKRGKYYSNEVRANILFIYHVLCRKSLNSVPGYKKALKEKRPINDRDAQAYYDFLWYDLSGDIRFQSLITRKRKEPIFSLFI